VIVASVSGRLAYDPREVATKSGKPMTTARLACDDDDGGTVWLDVVAFGGKAEWLARAVKGDRVAAMGKVKMNRWTDRQTGEEREALQLLADSIMAPAPKPKKAKPAAKADAKPAPAISDPFADEPSQEGGFDNDDPIPF